MLKYKGAIFDADGTLLDSMQIWSNAAYESLINRQEYNADNGTSGPGRGQTPFYLQTEYDIRGLSQDIHIKRRSMLSDFYFYEAQLKDGVIELLDFFRENGIKMCVATATDRWLMEPALKRCGVLDYFRQIFTCAEETTNKNSPDIFLSAAESLGTTISETLVFEDALYAIKSAKKAGFPVVAVYDYYSGDQQEEIKALADYYCLSMHEMIGLL